MTALAISVVLTPGEVPDSGLGAFGPVPAPCAVVVDAFGEVVTLLPPVVAGAPVPVAPPVEAAAVDIVAAVVLTVVGVVSVT